MQARPMQTDFFKWGGAAALVGGALGIIFNLLHPRTTENVGNSRAHLQMVADSDMWRLVHLGLALAVALGLIGIIAIALSMAGSPGDVWARGWLIFAAVSSAVMLILLAIDGTAIKALADRWAGSPNDPGVFAGALAVEKISISLFGAGAALFFGVSPILLAMAVFSSGVYPKALGQASLVAGGLGLLTALLLAIQGLTALSATYLFPIASLIGTVVLMWAGWELWKNHSTVGVTPGTTSTTVTHTEKTVTPGL